MMNRVSALILLLAAVSATAAPQSGEQSAKANADSAKSQKQAEKQKRQSTPDNFTPTEKIRADTTVAFPADI